MRERIRQLTAKRSSASVLALSCVVLLIGIAFAAGTPNPAPTSTAKVSKPAGTEGVHGGPKARFHDAAACNLTDVSELTGNWTHGDYVGAVAKSGDEAKIKTAARSRCGKPIHAGGRGSSAAAKAAKAGKR